MTGGCGRRPDPPLIARDLIAYSKEVLLFTITVSHLPHLTHHLIVPPMHKHATIYSRHPYTMALPIVLRRTALALYRDALRCVASARPHSAMTSSLIAPPFVGKGCPPLLNLLSSR